MKFNSNNQIRLLITFQHIVKNIIQFLVQFHNQVHKKKLNANVHILRGKLHAFSSFLSRLFAAWKWRHLPVLEAALSSLTIVKGGLTISLTASFFENGSKPALAKSCDPTIFGQGGLDTSTQWSHPSRFTVGTFRSATMATYPPFNLYNEKVCFPSIDFLSPANLDLKDIIQYLVSVVTCLHVIWVETLFQKKLFFRTREIIIKLEIKTFGLGSRTWDVCS